MYNAFGALQQAEGDAFNRQMQEQQWAFQKEQAAKADEEAEYNKKLAMAQLQASYGDLSGLKALGVDTSKYAAGGGSGGGYQYSNQNPNPPKKQDDTPKGLSAEVRNDLKYQYGSAIPADVWAQLAAEYGESALIAAGFTRKAEQKKPSGGGGGSSPGNGRDRVNMIM